MRTNKMRNSYIKQLVLCAMFVSMIAIGAFITIPIPTIPLTLQDLFVMLAGILLGPKWGALASLIYVVMGLAGLPVFTQGGGIAYVLKPTFGFLIGFSFCSWVTGTITHKSEEPGFKRISIACLAGIAVLYIFGTSYLYLMNRFYYGNTMAVWPMILACCIQPLPGDIIKSIIASVIGTRLLPMIRNGVI